MVVASREKDEQWHNFFKILRRLIALVDFKLRHKHLFALVRCHPRYIPLEKQSNMPQLK